MHAIVSSRTNGFLPDKRGLAEPVSIALTCEQLRFVNGICDRSRGATGKKLGRAAVIRAAVSAAAELLRQHDGLCLFDEGAIRKAILDCAAGRPYGEKWATDDRI